VKNVHGECEVSFRDVIFVIGETDIQAERTPEVGNEQVGLLKGTFCVWLMARRPSHTQSKFKRRKATSRWKADWPSSSVN
jgi:hypothetical protein